jgi:hypothetical protein
MGAAVAVQVASDSEHWHSKAAAQGRNTGFALLTALGPVHIATTMVIKGWCLLTCS